MYIFVISQQRLSAHFHLLKEDAVVPVRGNYGCVIVQLVWAGAGSKGKKVPFVCWMIENVHPSLVKC